MPHSFSFNSFSSRSDFESMLVMALNKRIQKEKKIVMTSNASTAHIVARSARKQFLRLQLSSFWYDTCAIYRYTRITFNWKNFNSISTFIWIHLIRFVLSATSSIWAHHRHQNSFIAWHQMCLRLTAIIIVSVLFFWRSSNFVRLVSSLTLPFVNKIMIFLCSCASFEYAFGCLISCAFCFLWSSAKFMKWKLSAWIATDSFGF